MKAATIAGGKPEIPPGVDDRPPCFVVVGTDAEGQQQTERDQTRPGRTPASDATTVTAARTVRTSRPPRAWVVDSAPDLASLHRQ